tara:strand:+ start:640 stop:987 length:348 start_codon:yes stop_codon:yes gene_type:complete
LFEKVFVEPSILAEPVFWTGYFIMVVNETPVVLRHVFPPAMKFRRYVEKRFGSDWHKWHLWIDYLWNGLLLTAIILADWEMKLVFLGWFLLFWGPIFLVIYLPLALKNRKNAGTH